MLSFVPDDLAWCDWIYGELQGHEVPVLLTGQATRDGFALPEYLTAFPDRFDPDHFDRYPEALATSRYLIVVCTPESANAPQIDAQIRAFKKAGGEERIIVLLATREPHAGQEKWPRSAECGWLPAWLRWRFSDDGAFFLADRTEPQIVEARAGWASLDEVKIALIAALLEMPVEELEELENVVAIAPPTPVEIAQPQPADDGSKSALPNPSEKAAVVSAMPAREPNPEPSGKSPDRSRLLIAGVVGGILASLLTTWFLQSASAPKNAEPAGNAVPALVAAPVQGPPLGEKVAAVVAPLAAQPSVAAQNPVPLVSEIPPSSPAVAPPPVELPPTQFLGPPPPTAAQIAAADDARMSAEKNALAAQADRLVLQHDLPSALETYEQALAAAQRFAGRRAGNADVQIEIALLCRKIGTLQAQLSSTAEARRNFDRARKILLPLRGKGASAKVRAKILEDAERSLRALPHD